MQEGDEVELPLDFDEDDYEESDDVFKQEPIDGDDGMYDEEEEIQSG